MTDAPRSIACNTLTILGVELKVHVLDNGHRIIEADGMHALIAAMAAGAKLTPEEADQLAREVRG